ncbi:MAG: hypothetical protein K2Q18_15290, partial [Bdellovibrionales bacterium]|nr:hypothetical protein [Bdellovibrionales bacterium]
FIVRTEIDERVLPPEERMPASDSKAAPENVRMIFHRPIKGSKEPIEGQQISIIPTENNANLKRDSKI